MPHNPRKADKKRSASSSLVITESAIADALQRAVELRRRTAVRPETVRGQAFHATEVMANTESREGNSVWARMQREGKTPEWLWIGWVHLEMGDWVWAEDAPVLLEKPYCGTWQVHLNSRDGRVWLRLERGFRAKDPNDPYP